MKLWNQLRNMKLMNICHLLCFNCKKQGKMLSLRVFSLHCKSKRGCPFDTCFQPIVYVCKHLQCDARISFPKPVLLHKFATSHKKMQSNYGPSDRGNMHNKLIFYLFKSSSFPNLSMAVFIWSIFIRAVRDHMTCYNLNWPKIKF